MKKLGDIFLYILIGIILIPLSIQLSFKSLSFLDISPRESIFFILLAVFFFVYLLGSGFILGKLVEKVKK